ncbi:MAG: ABC transporter substrate-binding protein, partial [bacterium]
MKINKKLIFFSLIIGLLIFSPLITAQETVIEDYEGKKVKIDLPVKKVVCLSSSANQIIMALDSFDRVVAWDSNSDEDLYPRPDKDLKVVAENSHSPQIEAIAELNPDIVIADTMLQEDHRKKLESFGIPVIVERTSDPDRLFTTIENIAQIFEKEKRGKRLISYISEYRQIIERRISSIDEKDKEKVYWEWRKPFKTGSAGSTAHSKIEQNGGLNIAADAKGKYPTVSKEYIWGNNPEIIVRQASRGATESEMKELHEEIINRNSLKSTTAVKNNNVHIITWDIFSGLPSIVGDLYFAKWI